MAQQQELFFETERWGKFELELHGPADGEGQAALRDVKLAARFQYRHRIVEVNGFYDGDGCYRIRFMPDTEGEWHFETVSNATELDSLRGRLQCTPPLPGNRGPVRVDRHIHFAYADGTPYAPFGTTCYVWNHQSEQLQAETLASLEAAGAFNKIRMCVFPKHYDYNLQEPELFPFAGSLQKGFDLDNFNPVFWRQLERRIEDLQRLGIEVDLILFHPYDRWGFAGMTPEQDDRYLRYALARLSAYRNIWWSLANEFDLLETHLKTKTMPDWDRFFRIIQEEDPYQHLRSIHNWHHPGLHYRSNLHWYDHGKPWVTHASIQHHDLNFVKEWIALYKKPIVVDECRYEGNLNHGWGNITGQAMVECFWRGAVQGGYVTHGETFWQEDEVIWWSHGGKLHGESPERIRFLRTIIEAAPQLGPVSADFEWDTAFGGVDDHYYLIYFGASQPIYRMLNLPDGIRFSIELIDTWEMTIKPLEGDYEGRCRVELPGKSYQALRIHKINE
jgi:hypothetical protein